MFLDLQKGRCQLAYRGTMFSCLTHVGIYDSILLQLNWMTALRCDVIWQDYIVESLYNTNVFLPCVMHCNCVHIFADSHSQQCLRLKWRPLTRMYTAGRMQCNTHCDWLPPKHSCTTPCDSLTGKWRMCKMRYLQKWRPGNPFENLCSLSIKIECEFIYFFGKIRTCPTDKWQGEGTCPGVGGNLSRTIGQRSWRTLDVAIFQWLFNDFQQFSSRMSNSMTFQVQSEIQWLFQLCANHVFATVTAI